MRLQVIGVTSAFSMMGLLFSSSKITIPNDIGFWDIEQYDLMGVKRKMIYYKDNYKQYSDLKILSVDSKDDIVTVNNSDNINNDGNNNIKLKAIIVTNVAGKCGLARNHYEEFVKLHEKYHDQGLEILAFPCSQFLNQEYSNVEDIIKTVASYGVRFPVFAKVDVNGKNTADIFQYCKYNCDQMRKKNNTLENIGWNFGKFLLDGEGKVVKYFGPRENPFKMTDLIEDLLKEKAEGDTNQS